MDKVNKVDGIHDGNESEIPQNDVVFHSRQVIQIATEEAKTLIKQGLDRKIVQFGWDEGGQFWLSRNQDEIVDPTMIEVEGAKFYFGIFKK